MAGFFADIQADDRIAEVDRRAAADGLVEQEVIKIQSPGEKQLAEIHDFVEQPALVQELHAMRNVVDDRVPGLLEDALINLFAAQREQATAEFVAWKHRLVDQTDIDAVPCQGVGGGGTGGAAADDENLVMAFHERGRAVFG